MKKMMLVMLSLISLLFFIVVPALAHTFELVNGETIEGNFIRGDRSIITIQTKEGLRQIPIKSISKITFHDDKLGKPESSGTLEGVAMYYFNTNYGYKPDIGSTIYIVKVLKNWNEWQKEGNGEFMFNPGTEDFVKILWIYSSASMSREMIASAKAEIDATATLPPEFQKFNATAQNEINDDLDNLTKLNAETDEGFALIDTNARNVLLDIFIGKIPSSKAIADGNGKFRVQLHPGSYLVVGQSNHSHRVTKTESQALSLAFVDIKSGQESQLSISFPASDF